ncbi:MAG: helix-turn-helix domain-containing protein [Erysipelotrichaceae bacterium]|nr:helix-turn-helix domain-containing protein [Erysipelotrichaceae bacterium]
MRLNADIIFRELSRQFPCEMYGPELNALSLGRAEFYLDGETEFLSDHLYLASIDHLPPRPQIRSNSMLICIGEGFALNYYRERMTVIAIRKKEDYFRVYQQLQSIYDKYDSWENRLYRNLASSYDIQALLDDSRDIFNKPLYVLDSSIKLIAATDQDTASLGITGSGALNYDSMDRYLSSSDLMFDRRNAMKIDLDGIKTLCVNLFDRHEQYEGCLCLNCNDSGFVSGDDRLAEFLAEIIEMAIEKKPDIVNDARTSVKRSLQALIEERPVSHSQRLILAQEGENNSYVCLYLRYGRGHNQLPLAYICDVFEESFPQSYALIKDDHIIGLVNVASLRDGKNGSYNVSLNRKLGEFIRGMNLCVGISNQFSDLDSLRIHYMQAYSAVENGLMMDRQGDFFYFSSYTLTQMIINSLGSLPLQAYFPAGLNALIEHDRTSGVSYLETLKVFLEENMSYTAAAQKLFIHRSTLIDRIARIEKELNLNLQDYDQRLQLEILLKAIDLEEALRQK